MFTRPADLPDATVADALRAGWGFEVDEIAYAPVGFGSHHWRVSGRDGAGDERRWFVTIDDLDARQRDDGDTRERAGIRLIAALRAAAALCMAGLDFVVAPIPTRAGAVTRPVNARYVAAVYEHVVGRTHRWGAYDSRVDRLAVLDRLVSIHTASDVADGVALVDDFGIPQREELLLALSGEDSTWGPGPLADAAERLLEQHRVAVVDVLARYDALVQDVERRPERFVLTHGEPHRANTIDTDDGVVLVDWDTALLAPPERDLWMLIGEDPAIAGGYTARTGVAVDTAAVDLYRLRWDLCEIALYVAEFRAPHVDSEDTRQAWAGLNEYLDPGRWEAP